MGGFYGSVQVRTEDRKRLKTVAEEVARALPCHMFVAPAIDGWIGLYPDTHGQNEQVGAAVAERIDADVLHLLVHDDDIFAYWLYRNHRLVDSFWSLPGYFGDDNLAQEQAMAGDPEAFRPLAGDQVKQLAPLLARGAGQPVFASETLAEFAKVLKIANAVTAYEYLKAGETDDIKKWRHFEEVPAERVLEEKKAEKTKRGQAKQVAKQLKSEGLLLLRDERKQLGAGYACGIGNGFFVAWPDHVAGTVDFAEYHPPWDAPRPRSLNTPAHIMGVATNSARTRLAMAAERRARIWDVTGADWSPLADVEESGLVMGVGLSPDGKLFAHASREGVVVTEVAGGRRVLAVANPGARQLQFDPTGEWIAVSGTTLGLIALGSQPAWRDLYVGGKLESPPVAPLLASQLEGMDVDQLVTQQRAELEKMIQKVQAAAAKSNQPAIAEQQIQAMRANMEKVIEQTRTHFAALKEGRAPEAPPRAKEQVGFAGFSRDGRWLWCGTHCGLRVYEWSQVPREAGVVMPEPTWKFDSPLDPQFHTPTWVWSVAQEVDAAAIAFGGAWGSIHRLNLETGEQRELLRVADGANVFSLVMAADGSALGSMSLLVPASARARSQGGRTCAWDVWAYSRLRGF